MTDNIWLSISVGRTLQESTQKVLQSWQMGSKESMGAYPASYGTLLCTDVLWTDLENSALQQFLLWGGCFSAVLHVRAKLAQKLQQAQANFWCYQLPSMFTKALHKQIQRQNLSKSYQLHFLLVA